MPSSKYSTVSIECCYQNVGIATSVALTMFKGDDLAEAMGVPFYYGLVEAFVLGIYCVGAWKAGWTKAPRNISCWKAISTSYEIMTVEKVENSSGNLTVSSNPDDPSEEGFHYVQHSEAVGIGCGVMPVSGIAAKKDGDDQGIEIGIRRQSRSQVCRKEPSYMVVEEPLIDSKAEI
jgi:hypothetical protein